MTNVFIDIETIPDQSQGALDRIKETLTPPGNISKQETIDKWWAEKAPEAAEEKYLKTSLDGTYGRILCIGVALNDMPATVFSGEEDAVLTAFYAFVSGLDNTMFIGHNIHKFDLPFIRHRSIINRIKPTCAMPDGRFNGQDAFCTMQSWAGYGNFIGLDRLCGVLGIDSPKDGIDGSKVWAYVQAGREQEVYDYCKRDVEATREVYKRITFS